MKKILLTILCIITIFTLTGCKNKDSINPGEFKIRMESKNYTVQDATKQFSRNPEIKQVYIALNSNYQIEYYELDTKENAQSFYNTNRALFEQSKGNSSIYTSKNIANYSTYKLRTNGQYKVVSRINNTVIYINANETYKSDIDSILDYLGY